MVADTLELVSPAAVIREFRGEHRFLSNFHPALVHLDGLAYRSVEHAYQASRTLNVGERRFIAELPTAIEAIRAGKAVTQRPDWHRLMLGIVRDLVTEKFTAHASLRDRLLATGVARIEEVNTRGETFWSTCNGVGRNHLGHILMTVRMQLAQGLLSGVYTGAHTQAIQRLIPFNELASDR